jgi:uncharacterized phage protein (TIGR01671 family)
MRNIKFRAWAGGVMVNFDLFNTHPIKGFDNDKHIQRTESPHLSVSDKCPIMEYTGLNDSKGVEIYEGDIVYSSGLDCFVEWEQQNCRFILKRKGKQRTIPQFTPLDRNHIQQYQVIGNIYENPLKESK